MNVSLVYPVGHDEPSVEEWAFVPLGLVYLATYLKREIPSVEVEVIDERIVSDAASLLTSRRADLVGFTLTGWNQARVYELAEIAHGVGARVVVGGVQASVLARQILLQRPFVEAVVIGEGEDALRAICAGEPFERIANLVYRREGTITRNPVAPVPWSRNEHPDRAIASPLAYLSKFKTMGGIGRLTNIISHRGCHYRDQTKARGCVFCASSGLEFDSRFRSPSAVIEEIRLLHDDYGIQRFRDYGEAMTPAFLRAFAGELAKEGRPLRDTSFEFYMRVAEFNEETAGLLASVQGSVIFGIESGSAATLRAARKGYSFATLERAVETSLHAGVACAYNIVLGLPGETIDTLDETFHWCASLPGNFRLKQASILVPVPGSLAFQWVSETVDFADAYGPDSDLFDWPVLQDIWARHFTQMSLAELEGMAERFSSLGRSLRSSPGI